MDTPNPQPLDLSSTPEKNPPVEPTLSAPVYVPSFLQPEHIAPGVVPKSPVAAAVLSSPISTVNQKPSAIKGPWVVAGCFGFFAFLFILFVGVLILGYNTNSTIFSTLGLATTDVEKILRTLLSVSFFLFAGIFLIIGVLNLFRYLLSKKDEAQRKKSALWATVISFFVVILTILSWVALSSTIKSAKPLTQSSTPIEVSYKDEATGTFLPLTSMVDLEAPLEVRYTISDQMLPAETESWKIKRYQWDLDGDGQYTQNEGNGRSVTYKYTSKGFNGGLYNVKMQATIEIVQPYQGKKAGEILEEVYGPGSENSGISLTFTKLRPIMKILTTPDILSGPVPFKVDFDGSNTFVGDEITAMEWDMDNDGTYESTGKKQTKVFDKIGKYKVSVRAINKEGATSTQLFQIETLEASAANPIITAEPMSGFAPLKVSLSAENSTAPQGRITGYDWDFGDGTAKETGKTVAHTFKKAGKFTVTLVTQTDIGISGKITQLIAVDTAKGSPEAQIRLKKDAASHTVDSGNIIKGSLPLMLILDGSFSTDPEGDIVDWQWDFDGDKKFDKSGKEVTYTYKKPGDYVLTLQVTDSAGNTSEQVKNVQVTAEDLTAVIQANPLSGEAPLPVAFDASGSSSAKGPIASYTWDFGDGSSPQITGAQISHEYMSPGNYIAKLTVRSTDGTKVETTQAISILEEQLLPSFTMTPPEGDAPATIVFDASTSLGKIISYRWDFGDGDTAAEKRPQHTYNKPGSYDVVLKIQDRNGNLQTTKKSIQVK